MAEALPRVKPRLRGVFHELAFFAAVGVGIPLALTAEPGKARLSAIVFASCVAVCFGASALYHRPTWQPRARSWLARLDHAGIYLLIAGTYTPFGLLVLSRGWAIPVLTIVWTGATAAILLKLFWPGLPEARVGGDRPRARLGRGRRLHAAPEAAGHRAPAGARRRCRLHARRAHVRTAQARSLSRVCSATTRFSTC